MYLQFCPEMTPKKLFKLSVLTFVWSWNKIRIRFKNNCWQKICYLFKKKVTNPSYVVLTQDPIINIDTWIMLHALKQLLPHMLSAIGASSSPKQTAYCAEVPVVLMVLVCEQWGVDINKPFVWYLARPQSDHTNCLSLFTGDNSGWYFQPDSSWQDKSALSRELSWTGHKKITPTNRTRGDTRAPAIFLRYELARTKSREGLALLDI